MRPVERFLGGHVEHFGDVLPLERDVEGVAVVARALTDFTRHVHVGEEMHLDLDGAVAGALAGSLLGAEDRALGPRTGL